MTNETMTKRELAENIANAWFPERIDRNSDVFKNHVIRDMRQKKVNLIAISRLADKVLLQREKENNLRA